MTEKPSFTTFSKPFIDAARGVFETMVFTKLNPNKPEIKNHKESLGDISSVLGLAGEVEYDGMKKSYQAMLVLSFPTATYLKIASAMLMAEYTEMNDEISDVGGELCNMIMGNAKRTLSQVGYSTNMAIPSMIQGAGHTINYPKSTIIVLIPIESAHGKFFMEICYQESEAS